MSDNGVNGPESDACRVVSRAELMAMPPGVIFSRYEPHILEAPQIKGETWEVDFLECDLLPTCGLGHDERIVTDHDYYGREGLFDDEQLYVVYSHGALRAIISTLSAALAQTDERKADAE